MDEYKPLANNTFVRFDYIGKNEWQYTVMTRVPEPYAYRYAVSSHLAHGTVNSTTDREMTNEIFEQLQREIGSKYATPDFPLAVNKYRNY